VRQKFGDENTRHLSLSYEDDWHLDLRPSPRAVRGGRIGG
jgi:hypothetical protein